MKKRILRIVIFFVLICFILSLPIIFSSGIALSKTKKAANSLKVQDLEASKSYIKDAKRQFRITKTILFVYTPLRIIPVFGWYVADIQRVVDTAVYSLEAADSFTQAITPYADVLGLKGQGNFLGGTAAERMAKAIETLSIISPQLNKVGDNLTKANAQFSKIAAWRYPNILPGNPGTKIKTAQNTLFQLESLLVDTKPLLIVLPKIMGQEGEKKYLILFQNDKELRPTGGFLTAYAIFRVNKGLIESEGSQDIYKLDDTLTKKIPAPEPIIKYLPNVPTLNIRDSNLSPDYLDSMKTFDDLYSHTQDKKDIDGIIALDTHFVLTMMKVLGDIEAFGTKFTTEEVKECNCPQIIYELEKYADQPVAFEKTERKGIIGVLMNQMMDKAFNAPKSTWPLLLGATIDSLKQKHLILYFKENDLQDAAERLNFAGRIHKYEGDYFTINESNFAGAKSNLYVQEKVKQEIKKGKDSNIVKKVTIEYKYPKQMDNCSLERKGGLCLAGIYRDWLRIYVPEGSQITKSQGATFETSQEFGKTLFDTFFELRPEGTLKIEFEYTVPLKLDNQYKLLIQKQPGVIGHEYQIEAFGKRQKFILNTDKEFVVKP